MSIGKQKKGKGPARLLKFPRVPSIKKRSEAHKDRRKAEPKHKTSWDRLDSLYQD